MASAFNSCPDFIASSLLEGVLFVLVCFCLFGGVAGKKVDAFKFHCLGVVEGQKIKLCKFVLDVDKYGSFFYNYLFCVRHKTLYFLRCRQILKNKSDVPNFGGRVNLHECVIF